MESQNGINSTSDRVALQKEVTALKNEISRIVSTSQFGGVNVLDGAFSSAFLVGAKAGQTISVNIERNGGFGVFGLFVSNTSVLTKAQASAAMTALSEGISTIDAQRADLGAIQNRFNRPSEI